jgi:hypothetical protein
MVALGSGALEELMEPLEPTGAGLYLVVDRESRCLPLRRHR